MLSDITSTGRTVQLLCPYSMAGSTAGVIMDNLSIFSLVLKTINLRMEIQHKKVKGEIKKTLENIMIELGSFGVCQLCVQV